MQLTASQPQYAFTPVMDASPSMPAMAPVQRFAGGGIAIPQGHDYRYSYDPADQSYALVGQNASSDNYGSGIGGLLNRLMNDLVRKGVIGQQNQPRYSYNPEGQTYTPMAAGGSVDAAQQTQAQGRGDDTMLVHMTPREVQGLQALAMAHGGSLTINPKTGLYEAGFLSSMLPTLIGAGLAAATGGTSLALSPLMTAGIVGAGYGLATGSLKKGLMAGLGAYGGANLASGLIGPESAGAEVYSTEAARQEAMRQAAAMQTTQDAALEASRAEAMRQAAAMEALAQKGVELGPQTWNLEAIQQAGVQPTISPDAWDMSKIQQAGASGKETFATKPVYERAWESAKAIPDQSIKTTLGQLGGTTGLSSIAAPIVSELAKPPGAGPKPKSYIREYDYAWNPNTQAYEPSPAPGDSSERRYFTPEFTAKPIYQVAGGGLLDLAQGGTYDDEAGKDDPYRFAAGGLKKPKTRSLTGDDFYKFAADRRDASMKAAVEQNFAAGGLGAAKQSLAPRFLSGGGDGMSDSIKANIDGKQEARLADGEFVVPADVVSHLGNGSSKAGAKKLYAMMDKIRKARTGKAKQAPAVKAERFMPA